MAIQDGVEVPRLFSRLQRAIEDEDDQQALQLSQKILKIAHDDHDALRCKLVSLIHLSKLDTALELINSLKKKKGWKSQFHFEEAYCLYRKEKYQESLSVISSLSRNDPRGMELRAQIAYRQERYRNSVEEYQTLLNIDTSPERYANYYAAFSLCPQLTSSGDVPSPYDTDTMEQCFNLVSCQLASGCGQTAMELLTRAESLYQKSLEEEGLTEEEIAEEMAIIEVQKGYIHQVRGRLELRKVCEE